ncbi:hypothetical protein QTH91_08830 [Variovorax dokdonensis]|uniref:Lipoprotein n=1 Tax=Variovorax dokdonensis TaxID=344883 RepID=A0ABT7N9F6_9BURK|nr:hypothetical protein [Variovorax dokdonensis]MDM0044582.1 hypothetical protein [Variovorax dokdonensis]
MSSFAHKGLSLLALAVLGVAGCGGGGGGGSANGAATGSGVAVAGTTGTTGTTGANATSSAGANASAPDIVDSSGNVTATTYRDTAQKIAQDAGILYRYGSPSAVGVATTVAQANSTAYPAYSPYESQVTWQVGGPYSDDAGDFSSNMGQYAFAPDNSGQYAGIGTLELLAQRNNTFSYAPQPSWTFPPAVAVAPAGANEYYNAGAPAALGRCYGYVCSQTVIAFANGTIGVFGSNTTTEARSEIKLDADKVPTAVAVTNAGEFALVTVWDTKNLKGQVAVIALAGSELLHMDWPLQHPGLPNMGAFGFMKLLGYVDLPGMNAPTEISATTNVDFESYQRLYLPTGSDPANCNRSSFVLYRDVLLSNETNRQTFMDGGCNAGAYPHGGVAVVVSKSEGKAAFINLKPLFDYYQSMYFGTRANFDRTLTLGQAANQWPFPFSEVSSQRPTLIKTVDLGKRPTAVKASIAGAQRAWIATEDGTLQIFSLGNYAGNGSASPADIALRGSMAVGKNPTSLAYVKHDNAGDLIVVSRGDNKIQWVQFSGNSGSVIRTLQDSRLKDPIWAEDNDNHGTESFVLTVADYAGKRVSNYRWGPVIFRSNPGTSCQPEAGCGMIGGGPFEYGGSFDVPGKVFQLTGANVP